MIKKKFFGFSRQNPVTGKYDIVFDPGDTELMNQELRRLADKRVYMTIDAERKPRSVDQNAYLWVVIGYAAEAMGVTKEEAYAFFLTMFSRKVVEIPTGDLHTAQLMRRYLGLPPEASHFSTVKTSSKMDTLEMTQFIERIRMWCAREDTLGIDIPDPEKIEIEP